MTSTQDLSFGVVKEGGYGTPGTVARWWELVSETIDYNKNIKQGAGLRVGGRVARSQRRVPVSADVGGDMVMEVTSKGMGLLWELLLGAGAATLVSGSTWQHVFTLGDAPPSHTVQIGYPEAGGTVDAITYNGMMAGGWELDFPNADLLTLKTSYNGHDLSTATGYAAPSYASAPNLFSFAGGSIATGTLTAPTATALASASGSVADIRSGQLQVDNNLTDRYNMVGTGRKVKPTVGLRAITGKLDVEYDSTVFRDAVLNDTPMCLILQWVGGALSTGFETLQVVLPEVKFDSEFPKSNGPDLMVPSLSFQALDNLTAAQPIWVVSRTSDAAL